MNQNFTNSKNKSQLEKDYQTLKNYLEQKKIKTSNKIISDDSESWDDDSYYDAQEYTTDYDATPQFQTPEVSFNSFRGREREKYANSATPKSSRKPGKEREVS